MRDIFSRISCIKEYVSRHARHVPRVPKLGGWACALAHNLTFHHHAPQQASTTTGKQSTGVSTALAFPKLQLNHTPTLRPALAGSPQV